MYMYIILIYMPGIAKPYSDDDDLHREIKFASIPR